MTITDLKFPDPLRDAIASNHICTQIFTVKEKIDNHTLVREEDSIIYDERGNMTTSYFVRGVCGRNGYYRYNKYGWLTGSNNVNNDSFCYYFNADRNMLYRISIVIGYKAGNIRKDTSYFYFDSTGYLLYSLETEMNYRRNNFTSYKYGLNHKLLSTDSRSVSLSNLLYDEDLSIIRYYYCGNRLDFSVRRVREAYSQKNSIYYIAYYRKNGLDSTIKIKNEDFENEYASIEYIKCRE